MAFYVQKHGEVIPQDIRNKISTRYHTVTKAINEEFWMINNSELHSFYVGSYGRGTAIKSSDLDILIQLPESEYYRYDTYKGNGQSRLLQTVKNAILNKYPNSNISADGQIIKIDFTDGIQFEILPAFQNNNIYIYADTNNGGKWRSTNPKAEQEAMYLKNRDSNGLLFDTCKHIRKIRDAKFSSEELTGIVIDSFVFTTIGYWHWCTEGELSTIPIGSYEKYLYQQAIVIEKSFQGIMHAPGSGLQVNYSDSINTLQKVLKFMAY